MPTHFDTSPSNSIQTAQPVQPSPNVVYLPSPATPPQGDLPTFLVVVAVTLLAKVLVDRPASSDK